MTETKNLGLFLQELRKGRGGTQKELTQITWIFAPIIMFQNSNFE